MNSDLIGSLASTLTTIAFVPQVWRAWKTRSARDLSLPMYLIFTAGVVLWWVPRERPVPMLDEADHDYHGSGDPDLHSFPNKPRGRTSTTTR